MRGNEISKVKAWIFCLSAVYSASVHEKYKQLILYLIVYHKKIRWQEFYYYKGCQQGGKLSYSELTHTGFM